ncbi:MAG: PHP domain-containing protein [Elusimicrobiales bacterium]
MYINLHSHSVYSDGRLDVRSLVEFAKKKRVLYFSITDHDTINAYSDAGIKYAQGLHLIRGVEISTKNHDYLHILGYGIKKTDELEKKLEDFRNRRISRINDIISKLRCLGIDISFDDLKISSMTTVGRPHIADALVEKGYGCSRNEAFLKYLVEGKPAYVEPRGPDVDEAIEVIKNAGGLAVLAHPRMVEKFFDIEMLIKKGFDGIEAFYPAHTSWGIKRYIEIAHKYNLIVTAGTDYHGPQTDRQDMDIYSCDLEEIKMMERLFNEL